MADEEYVEYACPGCGFVNRWNRDEVLQRGKKNIFKSAAKPREDFYTLPCKNPATKPCPERYVVAIEREN